LGENPAKLKVKLHVMAVNGLLRGECRGDRAGVTAAAGELSRCSVNEALIFVVVCCSNTPISLSTRVATRCSELAVSCAGNVYRVRHNIRVLLR